MMKKLSLFLFAQCLFLIGFCQDLENSLLWKVEVEDGKHSYIFGTIHLLPYSDFELKEKVNAAFADSEVLMLEVDITDPSLQQEMFQNLMMADGQTLDKLLSEEDYKALSDKLSSIEGMSPLATMNNFKPFMIAPLMLRDYIEGQPASFEFSLVSMADEKEMPVEGLETIQQQLAIFDSISYASQAEDLMDMIYKEDEMRALFSSMVEQYKAEEVNDLYKATEEYMQDEEEMNYLLYQRNQSWVEELSTRLGDKTYFIGVGAGHLGGEQGVIKLLREKGFKVSAVTD